ncbi:MAG TPA: PQQ-dependent sugar dehydrogenase [Vicinamibacteria bacterium]|nr:PQQ-dependent sugar dehydrogenase [Vicinamibacteria bacterium]
MIARLVFTPAVAALAALPLCAACTATSPDCTLLESGFGPRGEAGIRVERVASGLVVPWGLAFLPGGDVLVTERPGRVRLLRGSTLEPEPVVTLPVGERGEGGLLGIAPDPRFQENRRLYLYYTGEVGGRTVNRLVRYVLAADGRSAREDRVLLDGIAAERYHDGGRVRFGPDGMLHVGTGDAGRPERSQDPASPNGKILRLTTDGAPAPGNPFPGSPVFVLGVRNVEAFDWLDEGTLIVADHGPSGELGRTGHDEVSVARPGANLGWPDIYGCEARAGMVSPLLTSREAMPPGGGSVYRGDAIPAWKGSFLVGTLGSRHLHRYELSKEGRLARHEVYLEGDPPAGLGRVRDVEQGPDGALWVTTSNCDGRGTCPEEKDVLVRIVGR